ncbi:alpha/beta hydrolase [Streptomyces sp. NBC_00503]|uniref:alpha/beta hydrolase n=1 Tax=Streptomyces sp. NBC_00503 TaxID=2903659 RepID=UPI002E8224B4|nr:alpha/beta hydrolase [Streptomyces sp. NBC_00503]WUD82957.1 alpha/beta hydrolase [Streptomyces sp. NBC_00503]
MHRSRPRSIARSRSRSRSRRRIAAGFCATTLLLGGSLAAGPSPSPSPTPKPSTSESAGDGATAPRLRWGDCPEKSAPPEMRCATLSVPLDHDAPGKGSVKLALAKLPATETGSGGSGGRKPLGSLLLNFGGPGAPAVSTLAADPNAFSELNKRYDLVAFDPRGVGLSEPVSCGGAPEAGESASGGAGADTAAAELAALRAEARRCAKASGPVLPYIGTVSVARDMDVIREALGEKKLDFLGFSYGTRLGAVYAALFPRNTGRMVLDGVDTLGEPLTEQALRSAVGQQRALDNFLAWCARQKGCVYGTNTRTAKEKVEALVTRLDAEPLVGEGGVRFTGQDVTEAIGNALYSQRLWPPLAKALALVERDGDPVGLMQLGGPTEPPPPDTADEDPADKVPADNAQAALVAVSCADDPDRGDAKASPAAVEREIEELQPVFLAASPIFGPRQLMTVLSCYGRPAGTDYIRKIDRPAGIPRILLVGTRGDPATPYEWTEETAKRLGNTVVLDYKGDGHTGYVASPCVRGYVDHFLVDGRLPPGTRACPAGE